MSGEIDVLACHAGHTTIQFNKDDPIELDRTRRLIKQMIRMGCVLFIESNGAQIRVQDFDESCDCYIVADVPELEGLGDAVIPVTKPKNAESRVLPGEARQDDTSSGGSSDPAPVAELGSESTDSGEDGSARPGMAATPDSPPDGGKGRRGRGRRRVDASKVKGTVVPIQSGG